MQPVSPQRRDPAPSRMAYRMQRLWLTPLFRRFLRTWLPLGAFVGLLAIILSDVETRDALRAQVQSLTDAVQERPEFMVTLMAVDGASDAVSDDIRNILPVALPVSSFDLDLKAVRQTVEGIDAIANADVRLDSKTLVITVTERIPAIVWRSAEGLKLLDEEGHLVGPLAERSARADLPLIVGEGADAAVLEAQLLYALSRPVSHRVRGLVRVGARRWDVVLDQGQRILLPETRAGAALERVIALATVQDLLARDISVVDMRLGKRPTLRRGPLRAAVQISDTNNN